MRVRTDVQWGVFGAALVACACTFAVWGTPPLPPAPIVGLGIPSPLSGMTRSFVALASGDVIASFRWHPLGPVCFVACIVAAVNAVLRRRPRLVAFFLHPRFAVLVGVAFALTWICQIVELRGV